MLFLVLPQGYSQGKKEDSSVLGQVNGFLSKHVKLTAYGQFGYSYTDRKDLDVSQADNQFFGRLGMLILSGDITDKLSWMVQYELCYFTAAGTLCLLQTVFFFSGQDRSDEDLFYIREPDVIFGL